jgi:hypothetical protein
MHCALVIPGLISAAGALPSAAGAETSAVGALRLPALELLLARGRHASFPEQPLERWLVDAFAQDDEEPPIAAGSLTLLAHGGNPGDELWARADPVHLRLMRDRVLVVPSAAFSITREEAQALCDTLNRHFAGRLELRVAHPEQWCARIGAELDVETPSPLQVAGRETGLGRPGEALINEAQMLLHEHPVNEAREARGELPVNSLWLWGAGRAPRVARGRWHTVSADEPVSLGLARLAGTLGRALPASAEAFLERAPEDGRHLIVLDALRAPVALGDAEACRHRLEALEQRWFAPLLAALRDGRVGMITLHVPDAPSGVSFETIRGDLRRFWRRPRPVRDFN